MKFMVETGSESHTTSYQSCQAKLANSGEFLYSNKASIVSQEWLKSDKHAKVVKTVFELPEGTDILIDYKGHQGPEKFIVRLDSAEEVQTREIGTSNLRTYSMKGRFHLVRDLVKSSVDSLKASQEEGF